MSRSRKCVSVLLAAALGVAMASVGCAGDGGSRGASGARVNPPPPPEVAPDVAAMDKMGYRLEWRSAAVVGRRGRTLFFDPYGDVALFQDTTNTLSLIETATGRSRWAFEVEDPLTRFVGTARREERVYAASDSELFVLDIRTGEALERHRLDVVVNTRPTIMDNIAIFGCTNGEVLGHNLVSTYRQWGHQLEGAITAAPVIAGDTIAIVSQGGDVIVLDPVTGSSLGRARIFGGTTNSPVADEALVYVASTDQSVYAFERYGGALRWRDRNERPITDQPALDGDRLFTPIPGRGLVCFAAATGEVRWENKDIQGRAISRRGNRIVVWDGTTLTLADADRGDVVERAELRGFDRVVADGFVDAPIYLVTRDGRLAKFASR